MKRLLVYLSVLTSLSFSSVGFAQTSPAIVNNPSAPIRIVSTLANADDMLAALTMLNTSNRRVNRVSIGLIVTIPQGCAAAAYRSKERMHSFPVALDSNASTTLTNLHMSTIGINRLLSRVHGKDIVAQISIVGATYADGEKWTLTKPANKIYDEKMAAQTSQSRCGGKFEPVMPIT